MPVDKYGRTDVGTSQRVVSGGVTLSQVNNTFLRRDGENTATENINMDSHKLINVLDPANDQDTATKKYVDTKTLERVAKVGDTMTGNLTLSVGADSVRTFGCCDLSERKGFSIFLGSEQNQLKCQLNHPIKLVATDGVVCKQGINNIIRFGKAVGDLRTDVYQDIVMNQKFIVDLHDPTNAQDAATKNYVDTTKPQYLQVDVSGINTMNWIRLFTITGTEGSSIILSIQEKNSNGSGALMATVLINRTYPSGYTYTILPWGGGTFNIAINYGEIWVKKNYNGSTNLKGFITCFGSETTITIDGTTTRDNPPTGYINTDAGSRLYLGPNNYNISGVANPTAAQDVATKNYVDSLLSHSSLSSNGNNNTKITLTGQTFLGKQIYRLYFQGTSPSSNSEVTLIDSASNLIRYEGQIARASPNQMHDLHLIGNSGTIPNPQVSPIYFSGTFNTAGGSIKFFNNGGPVYSAQTYWVTIEYTTA